MTRLDCRWSVIFKSAFAWPRQLFMKRRFDFFNFLEFSSSFFFSFLFYFSLFLASLSNFFFLSFFLSLIHSFIHWFIHSVAVAFWVFWRTVTARSTQLALLILWDASRDSFWAVIEYRGSFADYPGNEFTAALKNISMEQMFDLGTLGLFRVWRRFCKFFRCSWRCYGNDLKSSELTCFCFF